MPVITSSIYVCQDNIDTDQILPAQYLALAPTIPEEYEKLGSFAMIGLPDDLYPVRFVPEGELKSPLQNHRWRAQFRLRRLSRACAHRPRRGRSRSRRGRMFARIFFRNSVATGELYPYDATERLCDKLQTGDIGKLLFDADTLSVNGVTHPLKPLGEVRPVIDAGGLFNYARQSGMIGAKS